MKGAVFSPKRVWVLIKNIICEINEILRYNRAFLNNFSEKKTQFDRMNYKKKWNLILRSLEISESMAVNIIFYLKSLSGHFNYLGSGSAFLSLELIRIRIFQMVVSGSTFYESGSATQDSWMWRTFPTNLLILI